MSKSMDSFKTNVELNFIESSGKKYSQKRRKLIIFLKIRNFSKFQAFNAVKNELISMQQTPQAQQQLVKDFEELMNEIQMNLEPVNRDKFTNHLNTFVMEVKKYIML